MTKNDNVYPIKRRTLSVSLWLTDITNQANVATRLGEAFGESAQRRVWEAAPDEWRTVASYYVDLVEGNHYGTRWKANDSTDPARTDGATGHGVQDDDEHAPVPNEPRIITPKPSDIYVDQVSGEHPGLTPLAGLIRFVGGKS